MARIPKLTADSGDATVQIGDAIAFLSYFGACLVTGGVAYNNAYNSAMKFDTKSTDDLLRCAVDFCVQVLWNDGYAWSVVPFFIVFACLFYSARFALRRPVGYLGLCVFLLTSFVGCTWLGNATGADAARKDRFLNTTSLPNIKIFLASRNQPLDFSQGPSLDSGEYYLLAANKDEIVVFVPIETEGSNTIIIALKRSDISKYQVEVK